MEPRRFDSHSDRLSPRQGSETGRALVIEPHLRSRLAPAADARAKAALRSPEWSYVCLLQAILQEIDGHEQRAADYYLQAIDKGEHRAHVLYRAAQILYGQNRFREAQQTMLKLEARTPLLGEHARLAANIALRLKEPQRALGLARTADGYQITTHGMAFTVESSGRTLSADRAASFKVTEKGFDFGSLGTLDGATFAARVSTAPAPASG